MSHPSSTLNLRWNGTGSYSIDFIEVDIHRHSSPVNARIDIGMDGVQEWSFSNDIISKWGLQDTFNSGKKANDLSIPSGGADVIGIYYPIRTGLSDSSYESKGNLMFSLTAIESPLNGVEVTFSVGGNELFTETIGVISNSQTIILSDSQMQDLVSEMESRTPAKE